MSILKNKHVIIALIVTPILAIISFFAVDAYVSEKPHKVVAGQSYELLAKPNCRYTSGLCELKNGNFLVTLTAAPNEQGGTELNLVSSHPLQGAQLAINGQEQPRAMQLENQLASSKSTKKSNKRWVLPLNQELNVDSTLRVALKAQDAVYFAEVSAVFVDKATVYGKTF